MTLPPGARDARRVGGGDINEAFRAVLADGSEAFVKTRADAAPGEYAAEATGLAWLAEPGALRTPRILAVDDGYLALEWLPAGRLDAAGVEELGRGLAETHEAAAPVFGAEGACAVVGFGSLRLSNEPAADWPSGCCRWRAWRASGRPCRRPEATQSSACAGACATWPARPSRRRACTATCGRAM